LLFDGLRTIFGDGIGSGDFYLGESMSGEQRLAHQFAFIHRKALAEQVETLGTAPMDDGEVEM
jgi:hypothetical protein